MSERIWKNGDCTLEALNARRPVLAKAWDLVCPALFAKKLAEAYSTNAGLTAALTKVSWKDDIHALITDMEIAEAGVSIHDVAEAIEFYTATEAKITRETIGGTAFVAYPKGEPGYMVVSPGYRGGPAAG